MLPSDMPESVIIQMINNSSFLHKATAKGNSVLPCSLKEQEFTFEFL